MDTKALRYFQTVAEFGSYSRAAEFLRLSQPALSRQVTGLERELGTALFVRHGHGISTTDAGRELLERSQSILHQLDQAKAQVRGGTGPSGTVTFAVPPAAGTFLVPELAERYAAACPNVFLKVAGGYSAYIHEWLVRGQVDLACLHDPLPQRGFETVPLVQEPVFVVGKTGMFPSRRDHVRVEDLEQLPMILPSRPNASRRLLDGWMAERRLILNLHMEVDDPSIIRALLRAGRGFSLLSRGTIETELRYGEVEARPLRPAASWRLALVIPMHRPQAAAVTGLAKTIRVLAGELTASGAWPGKLLSRTALA
ncbi:MAG TPA: LysR family transcriptional regulator [Acetobacteraceae bacterium]|nr:LysR family transcriptional regulator [Acetobacteraceae bacterium]